MSSTSQRLVDRLVGRQPPDTPEDQIARLIGRTTGRIRPRPAYRWRLRGRVVNQYVAVREGLQPPGPRAPVQMGSLGRAVLFASLGLAVSVSAVGAASSSALPGDPLYAVKRQVEELRMEIAPPSVRPALAEMALAERLSEVEQLAAAGNWNRVALAEQEVDGAVATLRGLGSSLTADQVADLTHHTQILTLLLARAPEAAQAGLERALVASAGVAAASNSGKHLDQGNLSGSSASGSNGNQGTANGGNSGNSEGNNSGGKSTGADAGTTATPNQSEPPRPHGSPAPHPSQQPAGSASSGAPSSPPAH